MKILSLLTLGAALAVAPTLASAHDYTLGALMIGHPWMRLPPAGAPVAGGFLTVTNAAATPDRLIAAASDYARKVEVHEMAVVDGVMKMRALDNGVEVPAGGKLELKPGSYHIMFIGPNRTVAVGDKVQGSLTFEKAGKIEVEFQVEAMGQKAPAEHDGHGAMPMK